MHSAASVREKVGSFLATCHMKVFNKLPLWNYKSVVENTNKNVLLNFVAEELFKILGSKCFNNKIKLN